MYKLKFESSRIYSKTTCIGILLILLINLISCARVTRIENHVDQTNAQVSQIRQDITTLSRTIDDLNVRTGGTTSQMRADLIMMLKELGMQLDRLSAELDESQYRLREMEKKVDLLRNQRLVVPANSKIDSSKNGSMGLTSPHPDALIPGFDSSSKLVNAPKLVEAFDVEKVYTQAREDFLAGKLDLALSGFQTVYDKDPTGGTYKENALYWLGECQYKKKEWDKAAQIYLRIPMEYPKGNKKCPSLFKAGLSFQNLGQSQKHQETWNQLQTACPGSNEANRAAALLSAESKDSTDTSP